MNVTSYTNVVGGLLTQYIILELIAIFILICVILILIIRNRVNTHRTMARYSLLSHTSKEFRKPFSRKQVFGSVIEKMMITIPKIRGVFFILYGQNKSRFIISRGIESKTLENFDLDKVMRKTLLEDSMLLIPFPQIKDRKGKSYRELLLFPLIIKDHIVGVMGVVYHSEKINTHQIALLQVLTEQISVELSSRLLQRRLDEYTKGFSLVEYSYESIVENLPSGVVALDTSGKILLFNHAMQNIIPTSKPVGKPYTHLWMRTGVHSRIKEFTQSLLEAKGLTGMRKLRFTKNNVEKVMNITGYPLKDTNNKVVIYVVIHQDITQEHNLEQKLYQTQRLAQKELESKVHVATQELVSANKELVRLNKLKTEFVSVISHELKTPMTSIKGYIALMESGRLGELSDQQKQSLGIVRKESDRLAALINDVLDLSRLESGKTTLKMTKGDIQDVLQEAVSIITPQAKEKEITITTQKDARYTLYMDANKIQQVIINLLSNAVKFTPDKGTINLAVKDKHSSIQVSVKDSGIGISKSQQKHLFEPFFQVEEHLTRNAAGTGLGLTICKHIMELHKGSIQVKSQPNKGTTMTIDIPKNLEAEMVSDN